MAKKKSIKMKNNDMKMTCGHGALHKCSSGCGYFLGFLGAAIYYISTATGFWHGVLGFLKAIIWPVFLVYHTLVFLGV